MVNTKAREQRRAALLACPLFQAMRVEEVDEVLRLATERRVPRGQVIFQKGDEGSSMMAVLRGRVRISAVSAEGREVMLNVINPGEVFGEIALLDGNPRSADATAIEPTDLLIIERKQFLPYLLANEGIYLRLLAVLCARLRQTSSALEDLALFALPVRLARVLLNLARDYGRPVGNGTRIEFKLSQRDISTLVGASRESVNKQLGQWKEAGVLGMDGGSLVVLQPDYLADLVA
jgi:CRP/FNR family cyclic AMP-dependent transcriptional regulator